MTMLLIAFVLGIAVGVYRAIFVRALRTVVYRYRPTLLDPEFRDRPTWANAWKYAAPKVAV